MAVLSYGYGSHCYFQTVKSIHSEVVAVDIDWWFMTQNNIHNQLTTKIKTNRSFVAVHVRKAFAKNPFYVDISFFWTTWTIRLRFKSNNYKRFRCTKQKWHRRPRVNPFTLYLLYLRRHFDFSGSLRLRCGLCFTLACRLCFGSSGCGGRSGCGCNRWGTSRRRLTLGLFGRWFRPLTRNICTQLKSRLPKYLHDRGWFSLIRELNEVIDLIWDSGFKLGITTSLLSSSLAPIDSRCYDTGEILVSTNLTQWLHSNVWLLDQGWMGKNMTWVGCTWKQRSTVGILVV